MKKFPVALQLYSLRDAFSKDFEGTLRQVKEIGYDGVEFAGLYGHSPADIAKMCKDMGLVPLSAHEGCDESLEDYDPVVKQYAEVGCQYIGIPSADPNNLPGGAKWDTYKGKIIAMSEAARKYGITLMYHNHDFEFQKTNGQYVLDALYAELPPEILQTELDLCWVNVGGENPAAFLKKYKGRAPVVHFKDFYMPGAKPDVLYGLITETKDEIAHNSREGFEFRSIGSGMQDVPAMLDACVYAGSQWIVVEQDEPTPGMDALTCVAQSVKYLKDLFDKE